MALYVSAARRRRRAALVALLVGVLALGVGWLIGRQQVPSVDERVAEVRAEAAAIAAGIERLDLEYEQTSSGTGADPVETSVLAPLDGLRVELQRTLDRAPWVTSAERARLLEGIAAARSGAIDHVDLEHFRGLLAVAASDIRTTLGG